VASLHRWLLARPGGRPPPPLVVNTGGWVRGLGLDVLGDTLRALPVTHFVSLASANPGRNLPLGPFWGAPGEPPPRALLWQVPGAQEAAAARPPPRQLAGWGAAPAYSLEGGDDAAPGAGRAALSAVEQRALQWAAFAQACAAAAAPPAAAAAAGPPPGGEQPELAAAPATPGDQLAAAVPFVVDLAVLEVHVLHGAASPAELPRVLNGAVVGLCRAAGAPPGAPLPCLGLGVVRAVDAAAGRAYVLTDVEEDALQAVDTLQVGRLELPPALLQTGGALSPYLALFSLATAGTGAGANKSRNNLQRAGQL
jgi:polynucleotide 5'-hydroxyl-kinase GRC3/NOL9